jgi:hypothetical protein
VVRNRWIGVGLWWFCRYGVVEWAEVSTAWRQIWNGGLALVCSWNPWWSGFMEEFWALPWIDLADEIENGNWRVVIDGMGGNSQGRVSVVEEKWLCPEKWSLAGGRQGFYEVNKANH